MACARVLLAVDADAHVVDESERHAAVQPRLGPVSVAALLSAEEEEGLHGGDLAVAVLHVFEELSDGVFGEEGAVVEGGEEVFHAAFAAAPAEGVGEDGVKQGLGEVRAAGFHVASEGGAVDEVEQWLHPAEVRVEKPAEGLLCLRQCCMECSAAGLRYRDISKPFKRSLSPGTVHKSFLVGFCLVSCMVPIDRIEMRAVRQLEKACRAMIGEPSISFNPEGFHRSGWTGTPATLRYRGRGIRDVARRCFLGLFLLGFQQRGLELLNALFEPLRVRQRWVSNTISLSSDD